MRSEVGSLRSAFRLPNLLPFPAHQHRILTMHPHGSILATIFGVIIIWVVFLDAFETVVLPRRVTRHFRLTALFYRRTWIPWRGLAGFFPEGTPKQSFLG